MATTDSMQKKIEKANEGPDMSNTDRTTMKNHYILARMLKRLKRFVTKVLWIQPQFYVN